MTMSNDDEVPRIAKARWGLLRAALRGIQPAECDRKASIHCFPGFQLLSRQEVDLLRETDPLYRERLLSQQEMVNDDNDMESLLWAIHSCQDEDADTTVKLQLHCHLVLSEQVRRDLAAKGILCRCTTTTTSSSSSSSTTEGQQQQQQQHFCTAWLPPNTEYILVDYELRCQDNKFLRIRERRPHGSKIKLHALTSQQHYDGVDNTGNTRVWDSELTLTYYLLQQEQEQPLMSLLNIQNLWDLRSRGNNSSHHHERLRILELGAGMAGLVGMALAVSNPKQTSVVLTDGHPDAVMNNRINIQLVRALSPEVMLSELDVTAQRLIWTTSEQDVGTTRTDELFDFIVACDCTHFTEFHASLALTTAHRLRVGGVALFCQPPRGNSLKQFVTLCNNIPGLWDVHWLQQDEFSDTISTLHRRHYQQEGGTTYDPNIHCPHLLVLRKLRPVEGMDRHAALQHMKERAADIPSG